MRELLQFWLMGAVVAFAAGKQCWSAEQPARHAVTASGIYVREERDAAWKVRLVGEISSLCGAYLVIHDAAGAIVYHGLVPHGKYPVEHPFEVSIGKDGFVGDYKLILLGHQNDSLGILAPYTDLPFEVYGGASFTIGHDYQVIPYFRVAPGVERLKLGAYKGHLKVLDQNDQVVADTRQNDETGKHDSVIEFAVKPEATYRLLRQCFYFRSYFPHTFYFAFDPQRWFQPAAALDEVKWWRGIKE